MIRWDYLSSIIDEKRREWDKESDTRYVIVDGLMEPGICKQLADFSMIERKRVGTMRKLHKHVRGKSGTPDRKFMTELQREFFTQINSERFLDIVSKITGISPIYADEKLGGGGLHQTRVGGYLNVHTDFNYDPETMKNRRLNLLLYLNETWQDDWAGNIELWDEKLDRPYFSAAPIENRVLIFETTEKSYHGHPVPLATPPNVVRKSMAVYYYSDWPEGVEYRKETGYQLTRQQWAQLIGRIGKIVAKRPATEDDVVRALELNYMTSDIRQAYNVLIGLRSAKVRKEEYWEYPDGTLTLVDPNTVDPKTKM